MTMRKRSSLTAGAFLRAPLPLAGGAAADARSEALRRRVQGLDLHEQPRQDVRFLAGVEAVVDGFLDGGQERLRRRVEAEQVAVLGEELADRDLALLLGEILRGAGPAPAFLPGRLGRGHGRGSFRGTGASVRMPCRIGDARRRIKGPGRGRRSAEQRPGRRRGCAARVGTATVNWRPKPPGELRRRRPEGVDREQHHARGVWSWFSSTSDLRLAADAVVREVQAVRGLPAAVEDPEREVQSVVDGRRRDHVTRRYSLGAGGGQGDGVPGLAREVPAGRCSSG